MAFGTKKSVVAAPSFSERMASIKSMFKTAHENASNLHAEWVISLRANRIKNDSTPQELRLIADKVEERLSQLNNSCKEE